MFDYPTCQKVVHKLDWASRLKTTYFLSIWALWLLETSITPDELFGAI